MTRKTEWTGITKAYAKRVLRSRGFPLADVREAFNLAPTFRSGTHYAVSEDGRKVAWVICDGCEEWSVRIVDAEGLSATEPAPEPAEPAQGAAANRPAWNCVDFPEGMHYTPGDDCLWCGKTRQEIEQQRTAEPGSAQKAADATVQDAVTEVAANVVVIAPDALGDFLAGINADRANSSSPMKVIDRARTVRDRNGITRVYRTAEPDRASSESAIGAYQRDGDSYRTYAVDGSSLGTWATETGAYNAIVGRSEPEPEAGTPDAGTPDAGTSEASLADVFHALHDLSQEYMANRMTYEEYKAAADNLNAIARGLQEAPTAPAPRVEGPDTTGSAPGRLEDLGLTHPTWVTAPAIVQTCDFEAEM